ncbi:hypothetical protein DTO166G5_4675 [Paecilomyces variotii]|nr:hypothetical protein DTO166G5_4675 [Paecilomyces variotii]
MAERTALYQDLSGTVTPLPEGSNPYQPLILASNDDPVELQARYETHRSTRNALQKAKLLDPSFAGFNCDEILAKLDGPNKDPGFVDTRHCLVFWARPPQHIKAMVDMIQREIREVAPTLWFPPPENLHMTTLEIANTLTRAQIEERVDVLQQAGAVPDIINYTFDHRARLIKPMVSYDASAMALSFVPAAGEATGPNRSAEADRYTYHHLRRDVYDKSVETGVKIGSRYTVPSAHITIARFITEDGFLVKDAPDGQKRIAHERVKELIERIERINQRLQTEFWPREDGTIKRGGEWIVGEEKGLDFHKGTLWYGKGDRIVIGKGF